MTFGTGGGATLVQNLSMTTAGANVVAYTCPASTMAIISFEQVYGGSSWSASLRRISPLDSTPSDTVIPLPASSGGGLSFTYSGSASLPDKALPFTEMPAVYASGGSTYWSWKNQLQLFPGEQIIYTLSSGIAIQYSVIEYATA